MRNLFLHINNLRIVLHRKFKQQAELRQLLNNIAWLFFDKALRMGIGLFINVGIARILGPAEFGIYSYAIAFVSLFGAAASLGLESIVIRDIIKNEYNVDRIMGSAFTLKLMGSITAMLLALISIKIFRQDDSRTFILVLIIALGMVFQSFNVIDLYFQSQIQSRYSVIAQNISFIIASCFKISLIVLKAPVETFALAALFEIAAGSLCLIFAFNITTGNVMNWRPELAICKKLLVDSWPLMLSYISYVLYTRVDQLMIDKFLDSKSLGIYSAAYRIYEIPLFLSLIYSQSFGPSMFRLYESSPSSYFSRYLKLTSVATWFSYLMLLSVFIGGEFSINFLYGDEFSEASPVLLILMLGQVAMFNGCMRSNHLTIVNGQKIIFATTLLSAVISISLNSAFIPFFGLKGAALSAVITQFSSLLFSNLIAQKTRKIFYIQFKSLITPPTKYLFTKVVHGSAN